MKLSSNIFHLVVVMSASVSASSGVSRLFGGFIDIELNYWGQFEECISKNNGTVHDVFNLFKGLKPISRAQKCMHGCVMELDGFLDANGKFNATFAKQLTNIVVEQFPLLVGILDDVIDNCSRIEAPSDKCEAMVTYEQCMTQLTDATLQKLSLTGVGLALRAKDSFGKPSAKSNDVAKSPVKLNFGKFKSKKYQKW